MLFELHDLSAIEAIQAQLAEARRNNKKIGLTSGSFDMIHFLHLLYLTRCRRMCDILLVGVDSDELVRERKGEGRPIHYDTRRAIMVDGLKPVSYTFILNSIDAFGHAAELFRPYIIFKNDSFLGREGDVLGKEYAEKIVIVRDVVDYSSTTAIIEEIAKGVALGKHPNEVK